MERATMRYAVACGFIAAAVAGGAAAQGQQVYRYVDKDGRIVYSDRIPPSDSKNVQSKRLRANFIENNELPLAAQQAQERFPVKLYTFSCGEVCTMAEALLNRRGVPFAIVNVETPEGAEQLAKLTGELRAPVLRSATRISSRATANRSGRRPSTKPAIQGARAARTPAAARPSSPGAAAGVKPHRRSPPGGYPKQ
jgi:glutaredoxin